MVLRERAIAKLKELGFRFKGDHWRVTLFKRGRERVEVPKRDILDDEWVKRTFRRVGLTSEQIDEFIRYCRN